MRRIEAEPVALRFAQAVRSIYPPVVLRCAPRGHMVGKHAGDDHS